MSTLDIEEMQTKFSISGNSLKISDAKRELKFKYQLMADIVAKFILANAGSFAALKTEKFKS